MFDEIVDPLSFVALDGLSERLGEDVSTGSRTGGSVVGIIDALVTWWLQRRRRKVRDGFIVKVERVLDIRPTDRAPAFLDGGTW